MSTKAFRAWCKNNKVLGPNTAKKLEQYDIEHVVAHKNGGAYHPDNYVLLRLSLNRLKQDDQLDYHYCRMLSFETCGRALRASVKFGKMSTAQLEKGIREIKASAPRSNMRLKGLTSGATALMFPAGSPKPTAKMPVAYKKHLSSSLKSQDNVLKLMRKLCENDASCKRKFAAKGWCDTTTQGAGCANGPKPMYVKALHEASKAASVSRDEL